MNKTLEQLFKEAQFFVEVTSFEKTVLKESFKKLISWEDDGYGYGYTVGYLKKGTKKMPVSIHVNCSTIGNKRVLFYEPTSVVVDYNMIENFLEKNFPIKYDNGTRRAMTNASNFHNCYHFCLED